MFGFKKDKINFLLEGLSQEKKNELISVQKWMNGLIENDGFKVPPKETLYRDNAVLDTIEKAFKGKKWLGNYSQSDGPWGSSKTIGPAMVIKEFERETSNNYKFKLECKIAVVFHLSAVQHFEHSDKYLKVQGLNDYEIQDRYTNFNLETPFYLYHFHFSKKKEVYKYLDEQDDPDYKSLKTLYDYSIEQKDKLTDLGFKIDALKRFPSPIYDTSYDDHYDIEVPYRDYGETAIYFSNKINIKNNNEIKKNHDIDDYNPEDDYLISFREMVTNLRSDFNLLKLNYKSWNDQVQEALKLESLTLDACKNIKLGGKVYVKLRNTVSKPKKQVFYYTDPNSLKNFIYEIDERFEKSIYTQASIPKLWFDGHEYAENVEYHLWIYNPIASDYDMDFKKNLEYYKKYFEKEGYVDKDILRRSILKTLDNFEKYRSVEEEWKPKSFINKYINKLEFDKFKSSNQTEEIIQAIATNRKKHEDFLWYNRDRPGCLTIEQKCYLKRKIFKELHLDDPHYSNGLNDKDKFSWKWLKELYDKKYNFD